MIKFTVFGVDIRISFWFFAILALVLTTGRETLAMYFLLPILIHECGHLIVMAICGVKLKSVSFLAFCIDIKPAESHIMSYGKDVAVALGGALANFLVAGFLYIFMFQSMRVMLLIAVNIAVALFNLVPVGRLDGGQVMSLLLSRYGGINNTDPVSKLCSFLLLIPLFALAIYLILQDGWNVSLLIVCLYLAGTVVFS